MYLLTWFWLYVYCMHCLLTVQMRSEARKTTKKANKVTVNINKFLRSSSIPTGPVASPVCPSESLEAENRNGITDKGDVTVTEECDNSSVDPATGEPSNMAACSGSHHDPAPEAENIEGSTDDSTSLASMYASSGPMTSQVEEAPPPSRVSGSESLTDVTEGVGGLKLDASVNSVTSTEIATPTDEEPQLSSETSPEKVSCKMDSLLFSLKKFCTPEHLTEDNRFACAVCTTELAMKKAVSEGKEASHPSQASGMEETQDSVPPEEKEGVRKECGGEVATSGCQSENSKDGSMSEGEAIFQHEEEDSDEQSSQDEGTLPFHCTMSCDILTVSHEQRESWFDK